jgi:hypothetical protein
MRERNLRGVVGLMVVAVAGFAANCGNVSPVRKDGGGGAAGSGGLAGAGGAAGGSDRDGSSADSDGPLGGAGGSGGSSDAAGRGGAGAGGAGPSGGRGGGAGSGGASGAGGGAGTSGGGATAGRGGATGGSGAGGVGGGSGAGGVGGGSGAGGARCTGSGVSTGCSDGSNCAAGSCVPATVSCAAHKSSYPSSGDGVYWIGPPAMRAYCDMRVPIALCTEVTEAHSGGRTRDGSNVTFALSSVLLWSQGECAIWSLRALPEGIPFGPYRRTHPLTTCQAFGFVADGQLGNCAYGDSPGYSACGFGASPLYQMGDDCAGCVVGDGPHDLYVRQGPMHESRVLTSADPSTQTRCKVR